jgi:8-oxo-dGTP pyrophosphatase MutT (NUDIX family)
MPWRKVRGKIEILLVTTRTTKRWVIPKGWPMKDHSPSECAAREAFEEAGVRGKISALPLGIYSYGKLRKSGRTVICKVKVFALKVTRQHTRWPEKSAREIEWCSPPEALERVKEIGLKRLIVKFTKQYR